MQRLVPGNFIITSIFRKKNALARYSPFEKEEQLPDQISRREGEFNGQPEFTGVFYLSLNT